VIKNFKNKKAASLIITFWYSTVLFWLAWLLVSVLISSQKFVWISEKFNIAIYWAESWIEQALFEINTHDIWFKDSTNWKSQADSNWFLNLWLWINWDRIKYKWWVSWLNKSTTETWYLVWNWDINKILEEDENRKFYKNFRKFYLYKDSAKIWEISNSWSIVNICNTESTEIKFFVDSTVVKLTPDYKKTNIIQWRLDTNEWESWTWYHIESSYECQESWDSKDPFCNTNTSWNFTHNSKLKFNSSNTPKTETIWICLDDVWVECKNQSIVDLLNKWDDPLKFDPYKPELTISYQNKLFESTDSEKNWLPIRYLLSWCTETLPSLVKTIESTAQTYWSVQKIISKIYQWNKGIDFNYVVVQ
jgi:hypothetical protein